ncbi:hypothetical protein RJ639_019902 [Escallonia herrerae]|uniref:Uncharacterized protein n=1 Tax=Escallonia herrerae TaxID=1293975 RepID=A0AA88V6I1_9ASTE|nr:hypothetical protein RJ639_019902 [Escallonia herrerae]
MASSKALQLFMLLTLFATSCIAQSPAAAPQVSPTATPTPSPTVAPPTPSPSPSPSPVAVPSPSPAPSSPTPSPSPSKTPTPAPSVAPSSPTPGPTVASPPAPPTAPTPADGPPSGTFADGWVNRAVIVGTALTGTCLAMALIMSRAVSHSRSVVEADILELLFKSSTVQDDDLYVRQERLVGVDKLYDTIRVAFNDKVSKMHFRCQVKAMDYMV